MAKQILGYLSHRTGNRDVSDKPPVGVEVITFVMGFSITGIPIDHLNLESPIDPACNGGDPYRVTTKLNGTVSQRGGHRQVQDRIVQRQIRARHAVRNDERRRKLSTVVDNPVTETDKSGLVLKEWRSRKRIGVYDFHAGPAFDGRQIPALAKRPPAKCLHTLVQGKGRYGGTPAKCRTSDILCQRQRLKRISPRRQQFPTIRKEISETT